MLTCLRFLGLPTRYVSEYLKTIPQKGQERLTNADASYEWISVFFCGAEADWADADLDPAKSRITASYALHR